MIKIIRLLILILVFWNIPGFSLVNFGEISGAFFSVITFFLIISYSIITKTIFKNNTYLILGAVYFLIAGINDFSSYNLLIPVAIKYMLFVFFGTTIIKHTSIAELFYVILFGAFSLFVEAFLLQTNVSGRYSGFYLNPNAAGFVLMIGFVVSLFVKSKLMKILGQIIFVIAGFFTFSRTFLVLLLLINAITIFISIRNVYKLFIGISLFAVFVTFNSIVNLDIKRLNSFSSLLEGKVSEELGQDSRTETWAGYYLQIYDKPIFGNGYLSFSGKTIGYGTNEISVQGVHNTFLMILGESGILVFLFLVYMYLSVIFYSYKEFRKKPILLLCSLTTVLYLLTTHNYFDNYIILFISIWIFKQIQNKDKLIIS